MDAILLPNRVDRLLLNPNPCGMLSGFIYTASAIDLPDDDYASLFLIRLRISEIVSPGRPMN